MGLLHCRARHFEMQPLVTCHVTKMPLAAGNKVPLAAVGMATVAGTWAGHNLAAQDLLLLQEGQVGVLQERQPTDL